MCVMLLLLQVKGRSGAVRSGAWGITTSPTVPTWEGNPGLPGPTHRGRTAESGPHVTELGTAGTEYLNGYPRVPANCSGGWDQGSAEWTQWGEGLQDGLVTVVSPRHDLERHKYIFVLYFDGLVQERFNSNALAMELRLSCINPSICTSTSIG